MTRKYPLRGYILGVLTHTTALDRFWGGFYSPLFHRVKELLYLNKVKIHNWDFGLGMVEG